MASRQVDGFIYATTAHRRVEVPRSLAGRPLVLLNCTADGQVPSVVPDEVRGGRDAAGVLLAAGHTRDIHLVGETPPASVPGQGRLQGLRPALAEAGTGLAGQLVRNWWPESAFDAVTRFLAGGGRPAAMVCLNDRTALGTYEALTAAGLRVPEDVSMVSFDGSPLASWLRPAVTSIALSHRQMGRLAVELLVDGSAVPDVHRVRMPAPAWVGGRSGAADATARRAGSPRGPVGVSHLCRPPVVPQADDPALSWPRVFHRWSPRHARRARVRLAPGRARRAVRAAQRLVGLLGELLRRETGPAPPGRPERP